MQYCEMDYGGSGGRARTKCGRADGTVNEGIKCHSQALNWRHVKDTQALIWTERILEFSMQVLQYFMIALTPMLQLCHSVLGNLSNLSTFALFFGSDLMICDFNPHRWHWNIEQSQQEAVAPTQPCLQESFWLLISLSFLCTFNPSFTLKALSHWSHWDGP